MARAIWKGALSFGLVTVPVELHTAVRDHRPRFRLLHARDASPVNYERVCQKEGEPVAWEDLVKGYEYEKGRFVVLSKDDFKAAALEKNRTIQILNFVNPEEIDDRYFETPYYLTPGAGGERAYALLREAIRESHRVGIAKFVLRDAQHLAAIEPIEEALVLTVMRFADELVDIDTLTFPAATEVSAKELQMAKSLVGSFAAEWDPAQYTDEYVQNLMRIIKAKLKGKQAKLQTEALEPKRAEVVDLMERLRRSLDATKARKTTARKKSSARKRRTAA